MIPTDVILDIQVRDEMQQTIEAGLAAELGGGADGVFVVDFAA